MGILLQCTISAAAHHFKRCFVQCGNPPLDAHGSAEARAVMDASPDQPARRRRGLLIVLSSPSGAGKSTISRMLLEADGEATMSVSATTRPRRPGEVEGVDYFFVDDGEFDRMIASGEFVEWAHVFAHRYGTPKAPVKAALRNGQDILFDIDWQGARQLEPDFGEHLVTIFLLPPSMGELETRLRKRGTDSSEVIEDRMRRAADEIDHWAEYEYVLVNRDMDACLARVQAIVMAERSKRVRQTGLVEFVRELIGPEH
jgi:guanylate kinase